MKLLPADLVTQTIYSRGMFKVPVAIRVTHEPSGLWVQDERRPKQGEHNLHCAKWRCIEDLQRILEPIEMPNIFRDMVFKQWVISPPQLFDDDENEKIVNYSQSLWAEATKWVLYHNALEVAQRLQAQERARLAQYQLSDHY